MSTKKDSAEAKEVTVADVKKEVDAIWGFVRKIVKRLEVQFGVDLDDDGKKGETITKFLIVVLSLAIVGGVAALAGNYFGINATNYWDDSGNIVCAGSVTATGGFVGAAAGDITCDDITANGSTNATMDLILDPTTDTNMLGTISVVGGRPGSAVQDNDFVTFNLYKGYDDQTQSTVYANMVVTPTDVSDTSEDAKIEFSTMVAGTMTEVAEVSAGAWTFPGDVTVSGTFSPAVSSYSNATAHVYCSNLTVKAGGTVTLPSASLASSALPAAIVNSTSFSNATAHVYASNLTVKAGGTVTLPAASVASAALADSASMVGVTTMLIATNANGGTNVATVTVKDIAGTAVTSPVFYRVYTSATKDGAIADGLDEFAVTTGCILLQEVATDSHELIVCTNITGVSTFTMTQAPGVTNWVHVIGPDGKRISAVNAFNVP